MTIATKWCALALPVALACSGNGNFTTALNQDDGGASGGASSGGAPGGGGSAGSSADGNSARATGGRSNGGVSNGGVSNGGASNGGASSGGGAGSSGGAGNGGVSGSGGATIGGAPSVCPGTPPAPAGYPLCRTAADCPGNFYVCWHDPAAGCGPGSPPPQCNIDGDCTSGQVCLVVAPSGCTGIANHCIPSCTSTSCAADEVCGANGHCGPKPCTAGYVCGAGTVCGPSRTGADVHGCAPASCSTDGYACPADFRCAASSSADVHGCSAISCTEGYKCPENFDCNPSSTALHQCDQRACRSDAECDCGACVQNRCEDRLFVCSMLPS